MINQTIRAALAVICKRYREPSTLIGTFAAAMGLAQSFGASITPDQITAITSFMGALLIVTPDKQHPGD